MEIAVPEACTLVGITYVAATDAAFDAAAEELGLKAGIGDISNTRHDGLSAYSYRHTSGEVGTLHVTLRGPKREMKLVPTDA